MRVPRLGSLWDNTTRSNLEQALNALEPLIAASELQPQQIPGNLYANIRRERALRLKSMLQFPQPTMCFDFKEGAGGTIYEITSQRPLVHTGTVSWHPDRGVLFNGSGAFQPAAGTIDHTAGSICDLSTLQEGEDITVAILYNHDPTLSGQHPLFYYGCSGENVYGGWGLVARTNGNLWFHHRAVGSSAEFAKNLANRDAGTAAANNTMTAAAFSLRKSVTNPEYIEISWADRLLEVNAGYNELGFSCNGGMRFDGDTGTGPARKSALGTISFGGKPAATFTNLSAQVAGNNGAFVGIKTFAIQRGPYIPGKYHAILEDFAAAPDEIPTSLFLE